MEGARESDREGEPCHRAAPGSDGASAAPVSDSGNAASASPPALLAAPTASSGGGGSGAGAASQTSSECVTVMTRDGVSFVVEAAVARQSPFLETLMEGASGSTDAVPLSHVSAAALQLILSYYRAADGDVCSRIAGGWNMPQLCDVLLACDYLALDRLQSYACDRIASSITACEHLAAIRGLFGVKSDLPEANEAYVQKVAVWLAEKSYRSSPVTSQPVASAAVEPAVVADVLYRLATSGFEEAAARCVYLCTATAKHEGLCAAVSRVHLGHFKRTHLMAACAVGGAARVEWWLKCGADVNAKDSDGYTPLHLACSRGLESVALRLIELGGDVNAKASGGCTPLHNACSDGGLESVALRLIELGGDVNAKGFGGSTPLHLACGKGLESVALRLLELGADVNAEDEWGNTPLQLVLQQPDGNAAIVSMLEKYTAAPIPAHAPAPASAGLQVVSSEQPAASSK